MKSAKLDWRPISERPDEPGFYLVWSYRTGMRLTTVHPSWWNKDNQYLDRVGRVTKWVYLGDMGLSINLRKRIASGKTSSQEK